MMKKHALIALAAAFCLAAALFMAIPATSQTIEYDPWLDTDDNGVINMLDVYNIARLYGTIGEPINKTALLLELQAKVDSLNASLIELESRLDGLYIANVKAYCLAEAKEVSVNLTLDGNRSGYRTPYHFVFDGEHTMTAPSFDSSNHPFKEWSTGSTNTSITVDSPGDYVAYYEYAVLNISQEIASSGEIGFYNYSSGFEVSVINWGLMVQGETRTVQLVMQNKGLPLGNYHVFWTTNSSLLDCLHLTMGWGPYPSTVPWPENEGRDWWSNDVIWLTFRLAVDSDAPETTTSFTQTFWTELHP